jgi:DNA topoisomerase I
MTSLIIVESYTKTKTIKKYINDNNYIITFSSGHIYNLPKDKLGFNTETWDIEYVKTNIKIINNIRELVKKSNKIYLAADPDLEGEAIANNVKDSINDLIKGKECYRITFNEITKNAILNALSCPRDIDNDVVKAQETRRIVDRMIGYKVSPILWSKFNMNHLSAGRVQIAALILCINQRNSIIAKEIKKYWNIEGVFKINKKKFSITAKLLNRNEYFKSYDIQEVRDIINTINIETIWNTSFNIKERFESPPPPYTTTTMQQDSYNKFKYNAKNTMKLAQDLYENGLITYLRTDSTSISDDAKKSLLNYINNVYSKEYAKYRTYKTKITNAQEAHEAIRITNPTIERCDFEGCNSGHIKLYDMIRKRTLASLMSDAKYTDIIVLFDNKDTKEYVFKATKSFLTFDGFTILYNNEIECYKEYIELLKNKFYLKELIATGNVDDIPSLYNEIQLIKQLEKQGIGRPSTYSTIIDKLLEKKYVEIGKNPQQEYNIESLYKNNEGVIVKNKIINLGGKQKDLLVPTELGINIIKYIYEVMPYLCDLKFTSNMESDLDNIMKSKIKKEDILNSIYSKILDSLKAVDIKTPAIKNDKKSYETGIIETRYGACYYNKELNKYTNIESYLKWKNINIKQLQDNEIKFISSLPKKITYNNTEHYLNIGKYGLYLKDKFGKNIKLDKKLWNTFIN